jgi:hypothetical protein
VGVEFDVNDMEGFRIQNRVSNYAIIVLKFLALTSIQPILTSDVNQDGDEELLFGTQVSLEYLIFMIRDIHHWYTVGPSCSSFPRISATSRCHNFGVEEEVAMCATPRREWQCRLLLYLTKCQPCWA